MLIFQCGAGEGTSYADRIALAERLLTERDDIQAVQIYEYPHGGRSGRHHTYARCPIERDVLCIDTTNDGVSYGARGEAVRRAILSKYKRVLMNQPVYYECGICDHFHPWHWDGDCRDDANRLTYDQLDERHGQDGYELRSMDERVTADLLSSGKCHAQQTQERFRL